MEKYLVIYDVRGIQKYIFKTNKIKEISGASYIVKNLLINELKKCFNRRPDWKVADDWMNLDGFQMLIDDTITAEYIYNGGGNLLVAFNCAKNDLDAFNRELQLEFLKNSYSLSLACACIPIDFKEDFVDARKHVNEELKKVKIKMPESVMQKSLPIVKQDSISGFPVSDVDTYLKENGIKGDRIYSLREKTSVESVLKQIQPVDTVNKKIDLMLSNYTSDKVISTDKNMIAVVHIDGNDMGVMISNFFDNMVKYDKNLTIEKLFSEQVKTSRWISKSIYKVFNKDIEEIFAKDEYKEYTRLIINSGDDITFICTANIALQLSREIMISIQEKENALVPENSTDKIFKQNRFSSCGGICYIHPHFPFYRAYEIAEEVCSIAKVKAKLDRKETALKIKKKNKLDKYYRPTSYLDFHICDNGIIKPVSDIRNEMLIEDNVDLFIRPYLVDKAPNEKNIEHIDNLLNLLKQFRTKNEKGEYIIARSTLKEIRNTYEKPRVYNELLFRRLKSRKAFDKAFEEFEYKPYDEDGKALYYDSTTLLDLVDFLTIKEGEE